MWDTRIKSASFLVSAALAIMLMLQRACDPSVDQELTAHTHIHTHKPLRKLPSVLEVLVLEGTETRFTSTCCPCIYLLDMKSWGRGPRGQRSGWVANVITLWHICQLQ